MVLLVDTTGMLGSFMGRISRRFWRLEDIHGSIRSPKGVRVASAGIFIAFAANVLAMAPGINIGAAYHAAFGGEPPETELGTR